MHALSRLAHGGFAAAIVAWRGRPPRSFHRVRSSQRSAPLTSADRSSEGSSSSRYAATFGGRNYPAQLARYRVVRLPSPQEVERWLATVERAQEARGIATARVMWPSRTSDVVRLFPRARLHGQVRRLRERLGDGGRRRDVLEVGARRVQRSVPQGLLDRVE